MFIDEACVQNLIRYQAFFLFNVLYIWASSSNLLRSRFSDKRVIKSLYLYTEKIVSMKCEFIKPTLIYSLAQKQLIKFSIEKSLVLFSVKLIEILHASTYDILVYIYKVKKPAADGNSDLQAFWQPWSLPPWSAL